MMFGDDGLVAASSLREIFHLESRAGAETRS